MSRVITESLAKSRWPDRDPIGLVVQFGNMDSHLEPITIVGIVGDIRDRNIEATAASDALCERASAAESHRRVSPW